MPRLTRHQNSRLRCRELCCLIPLGGLIRFSQALDRWTYRQDVSLPRQCAVSDVCAHPYDLISSSIQRIEVDEDAPDGGPASSLQEASEFGDVSRVAPHAAIETKWTHLYMSAP